MKAKASKRNGALAPRARTRTTPVGPMNEGVFWALVARFDWKHAGDDDDVIGPAVAALSRMSVDDIFAFDDLLSEKLYALDTREMCRGIYRGQLDPDDGDAYVSADGFLYARCTIVANGRALYEATLADPMAAPQDSEFEGLLYLAGAAYEKKVGDEYPHVTPVSWESFSNTEGWKTTAATTPGRFTGDGVPPGNRRPT